MILLLHPIRRISKIGKKLIILLIGFSSVIALLVTAGQLFMDYRVQRDEVNDLLNRVTIFFPPIAEAVWNLDDRQIKLSLNSLAALPNIDRVAVRDGDSNTQWEARSRISSQQIQVSYPLVATVQGQERHIAEIEITAGLDGLYRTLMWKAVTILLSNGVKTFLVAIFLYAVTRHLVTYRVEELARRAHGLVPQLSPEAMSVPGSLVTGPARGDELDEVRWAFDDMAERMKLLVTDLNARNLQLAAENRQRQKAEGDLRDAIEKLSRTVVQLERFTFVAYHDLREPIRAIVSFSQVLERNCGEQLDDSTRQYLGFVIAGAKRLSSLMSDLMDYGRSEELVMVMQPVDSAMLLARVVEEFADSIAAQQAEVVPAHLPQVVADPGQLHQLFRHLMSNALKYRKTGLASRIDIGAIEQDGAWLFHFRDNGIGIDPQYATQIFEVFRRLHKDDSYTGTGIGLAICKRVIENLGGRIWLDLDYRDGTQFCFTIPKRDLS